MDERNYREIYGAGSENEESDVILRNVNRRHSLAKKTLSFSSQASSQSQNSLNDSLLQTPPRTPMAANSEDLSGVGAASDADISQTTSPQASPSRSASLGAETESGDGERSSTEPVTEQEDSQPRRPLRQINYNSEVKFSETTRRKRKLNLDGYR